MTPALSAVYEVLLERASRAPHRARADAWRSQFEARTGQFPAEHGSSEARIAAAWEDALVAGGLAAAVAGDLADASERALAVVLSRAQRGIFRAEAHEAHHAVRDLWGGGLFVLLPRDELSRANDGGDEAVFVGRIVAGTDGCAVLPGRVWLPGETSPLLEGLLGEADARGLDLDATADALLRMDHAYATLSRVKVGYAFRSSALPSPPR